MQKSISSKVTLAAALKFLQTLAMNKLKLLMVVFVEFRPKTPNMNCSRSRKILQNKCASIFSKVCPLRHENAENRVGI